MQLSGSRWRPAHDSSIAKVPPRHGRGRMFSMLSIFIAHNDYRSSSPSGEDVVFEAEAELLSARGHVVHKYVRRSDDIAKFSFARQAALGKEIIWSQQS